MHGFSPIISEFLHRIAYIKTRTAFSALGPFGPLAECSARFYRSKILAVFAEPCLWIFGLVVTLESHFESRFSSP